MGGHKIDGFRADQFRGGHKVPFIFPTLIVHHDDDLSFSDVLNGILNGIQLCLFILDYHHFSISFFFLIKLNSALTRSIRCPNPTNPLSAVARLVRDTPRGSMIKVDSQAPMAGCMFPSLA